MSSSLTGPCHFFIGLQGSLGGEVYVFSEMIHRMALSREIYVSFSGVSTGMEGKADCVSLFTHLKNRKLLLEKYSVGHFVSIRQFIEDDESEKTKTLTCKAIERK